MSDNFQTPPAPDGQPSEAEGALKQHELDIRAAEARVKETELEVRRLEAEATKRNAIAPWWRNPSPLLIAVAAGAVTLGGNAYIAYYNGYTTREQEKIRAENALDVEKEKSKAALILQAIATNDAAKAYANIQFFISSGVLPDDDHKILEAARRFAPFLPASAPIAGAPGSIPAERLQHLAQGGLMLGISVSNTKQSIDFDNLKAHDIQFAYIKVSQGSSFVDSKGFEFAKLAKQSGIKVGLYHFFSPNDDVEAQTTNFLSRLDSVQWDLPPVIDCEWSLDPNIPSDYAARVEHFAAMLEERLGVKPIIYTTRLFALRHLDERDAKYPLFIAQFATSDQVTTPVVPKGWTDYVFWHVAPGVNDDPVLRGYDIIGFRGSAADLAALNSGRK